jgi:ribosomal protein S18 acetylase RimI-like enzyme
VQATELVLRPPTLEDASAIADVLNEQIRSLGGPAVETAESIERWFALETVSPADDVFVALDDGQIVGYADANLPADEAGVVHLDVRVSPGRKDAAELLLRAVERRAGELGGPETRLRASALERDEAYRGCLSRRSFEIVRSSFTMEIDLARPTDEPVWPDGLRSRPFEREEARAVYDAYVEAFAEHWGFVAESFADWCTWNVGASDDTSLWRVVEDRGEIAGLCMSKPSRGPDETLGWLSVLAVRGPWRRRGLARALLLESFGLFRSIGRRRAGLGVDGDNTTGALALYLGAGMKVTSRWDAWERAL